MKIERKNLHTSILILPPKIHFESRVFEIMKLAFSHDIYYFSNWKLQVPYYVEELSFPLEISLR